MSDVVFRDDEHHFRFARLQAIAYDTVQTLKRAGASPEALVLNDEVLAAAVRWHYRAVEDYKIEERYEDGARVNLPKVAAFAARSIMRFQPIELAPDAEPSYWSVMANPIYAQDAFYSLNFVDPELLPEAVDEMILRAFLEETMNTNWMVLTAEALGTENCRLPKYDTIIRGRPTS